MGEKGTYVSNLADGNIPGGHHTKIDEKTISNLGSPRENQETKDHLDKKGMHTSLKFLLDDLECNVTNMFALRGYYSAN